MAHYDQWAHAASFVSWVVLVSDSSGCDGVNDDVLSSRKPQTSPRMPNSPAAGTVG